MDLTLNTLPHKPTILVLGDIMLDHTLSGSVTKLANEAPVPVFKDSRETWSLGGAGNVVANLAHMGCAKIYCFGSVGDDSAGAIVSSCLKKYSAHNELLVDSKFQTIVKHRYYCGKTLLFRHDNETPCPLVEDDVQYIMQRINDICTTSRVDCIVLSDYNKGFLTHALCQKVIAFANANNIFTCVDPKEDFTKYVGCSLIKPNRTETAKLFGIVVNGTNTRDAHECIHARVGCKTSVITLSEDGISVFDGQRIVHRSNQPMEVIDVTGAGDIVCAILGYLYPLLEDKELVLQYANYFAMISVGHLGSYVLQPRDFLQCRIHSTKYVAEPQQLCKILKVAHDAGLVSVFTNGCFDILHVGHLDLLKRCKSMGDLVIVGLNSDASIGRLKGSNRPIMNVEKRIAFLNALEYVDYICVFDEDTPASLLEQLRPTILVKGGDYDVSQVIGREFVQRVCIVPFVEGYSTTSVIQRVRESTP